jgi:hypothetical protein
MKIIVLAHRKDDPCGVAAPDGFRQIMENLKLEGEVHVE